MFDTLKNIWDAQRFVTPPDPDVAEMIAFLGLTEVEKGEGPGHEFRGNQYTDAGGGGGGGKGTGNTADVKAARRNLKEAGWKHAGTVEGIGRFEHPTAGLITVSSTGWKHTTGPGQGAKTIASGRSVASLNSHLMLHSGKVK